MSVKTVSLGTAKLLKELGFPQFTYMCFALENKGGKDWEYELMPNHFQTELEFIGAPTTDELLDELPYFIKGYFLMVIKNKDNYWVGYDNEFNTGNKTMHAKENESLPEATAQMWLYLKKENLL